MRVSLVLLAAVFASTARAQQPAPPAADSDYATSDVMIPMPDGVRPHTVTVTPKNATAPLPSLMERTPYGTEGFAASVPRRAKRLSLDGYIHVEQDIRGRFGSEGAFDLHRRPYSGHAGTDGSTDTYDTIDWLVKNVPNNNGRVGVLGISYPGWLTAVAGIGAHPALKAISPQAPMGDAWMGDDFFHQGAFRQTYGLEYAWEMEASSNMSVTPSPERYDTFEWYLSFPTLGALAQAVGANHWPTWRRFAEATVYDAGSNEWRTFDTWPPATAAHRHLYFRAGGGLSFDPPTTAAGDDQYVSDPARPVPYRPRPVERTYSRTSRWRRWETEDQRFVDGRPDVLTWQTGPLAEDVTLAGNVVAHLYAATTGSDAEWVAKLIDVYPDTLPDRPTMGGYELMVTGDVMRGRYRQSWDRPTPIPPNRVLEYTVDLHQQAYTFRKGHRIMVQVQSTWFPLYDRNPQTFVPNIFNARAGDYRARVHRVYRTARYPSNVEVDVVSAAR